MEGVDDPIECVYCDYKVDVSEFSEKLDTKGPIDYKDNYYYCINCAECSSPDSVVENDGYYICVNCRNFSKVITNCEWCNEGQLGGILKHSFLDGCDFCGGRKAHVKDD